MPRLQFVRRLGALLAIVTTTLAAQTNVRNWDTVKALTTGTQVRVTTGSGAARGQIGRVTDDTLVMTSGKGPETFDRQQITVISTKKPGHHKRNTLIGLAAGTGVGLGIGIAARAKPGDLQIIPNAAIVGILTAAGALVGTVVGVVIPAGGWREIYKK